MFTDMVGFTARTQSDEKGTLELLREQEDLVRPLLETHHGRTVKSTGDGFLVEFPSALQATECAVEIQQRLHGRNLRAGVVPIELRIGIHLGDVEQRNEDIFGDAVNIASRVQPTADAGGVAISQQVFDQVRNKLHLPLEKLEPKSLKGLRFPMDVYRVVFPWNAPTADGVETPPSNRIAVLPFANISPDPHDAYFSDGLTEELITVLSQLGGLRVIARTSVDPYKITPKSIPQVGADLGVSWVLEGSVRKAGNRLRIAVQLIDVRSQEHLWASTYDRELDDVFALQSEMAKQVADALKIQLLDREEARLDRRSPPRPESYLEYLQGRASLRQVTEAAMREAVGHFERAISLDDRNAAAHAGLADGIAFLGSMYHHLPRSEWQAASRQHAARAIELDPDLAEAHTSIAMVRADDFEFAAAEAEFRTAIALNPSFAWARQWHADLLADLGRPEEALQEFALAEQLDPLSTLVVGEEVALLIDLRRLDLAEAQLEKLGAIENFGLLYHDRKFALALARDDAESRLREISVLSELLAGRPEITSGYAVHYARTGEVEKARERLKEVEALPEPIRPDQGIALAYAFLGDLDACFRWLEVTRDAKRLSPRRWRYDPDLARLRSDPRFPELFRKMNLAVVGEVP